MRETELPASTGTVAAAVEALWAGVRLVVVDTETTVVNDDEWAAVSVGFVSCTNGVVRSAWQQLLDPGVPVDPDSAKIHHLNDSVLRGAPRFADIANTIRNSLTPAHEDELVVLVAFSVGFDVGVLRSEFERLGQTMPEVRVLDVRGGLPRYVGVKPAGGRLAQLCDVLGITNSRPHDALADAVACADAAMKLIGLAAARGERDFGALLDAVAGNETTLTVAGVPPSVVRRNRKAETLVPDLPAVHTETHAVVLSGRAGRKMLEAWRAEVAECAKLRCSLLSDRASTAGPAPNRLLPELHAVLGDCAQRDDIAGTATVLEAMFPLMGGIAVGSTPTARRNAVLWWVDEWEPLLTPLGRCAPNDRCPACQRTEPCPLDIWPDVLATHAVGKLDGGKEGKNRAVSFLRVTGKRRNTGPFTAWRQTSTRKRIADASLWLVINHHLNNRQTGHADQLVVRGWELGSRHPDLSERYCRLLSIAGDETSLQDALAVAQKALRTQHGSTHEGWHRLRARARSVGGRLDRMRFRHSGNFDEHGNPVALRLHHPTEPKRPPLRRFQRKLGA